jgi:hypothetical protein
MIPDPTPPPAVRQADWRIWSDKAARFSAYVPTAEEDEQLTAIALRQQPAALSVEIGTLLLSKVAELPNDPFLPVLWVKERLTNGQGGPTT